MYKYIINILFMRGKVFQIYTNIISIYNCNPTMFNIMKIDLN